MRILHTLRKKFDARMRRIARNVQHQSHTSIRLYNDNWEHAPSILTNLDDLLMIVLPNREDCSV
jgi:Mg2+/Co2+ transporter CorB